MAIKCTLCPELVKSRHRIVEPEYYGGVGDPQVLVIAEAPGYEEDRVGRPLIGTSGQEARHHLDVNGITSRGVCLTNMVMCHPKGDRDPKAEEIRNCAAEHLGKLVADLDPEYIITMGRVSSRAFLGGVDMELCHGIPQLGSYCTWAGTIIPVYHPAAGLHSPETMIMFQTDMRAAGDVIRGKDLFQYPDAYAGKERYNTIDTDAEVAEYTNYEKVVSIDTESAKGKPWCLSLSVDPGEAIVVMSDQRGALDWISWLVSDERVTTLLHNAAYDLPVLAEMGIHPAKPACTMVMAYLLQSEPQGLKPLAYRHCSMEMVSYAEMVRDATQAKAQAYFERILQYEWPDPKPVLEWPKGLPHVRQPQNITTKIKKALKAATKDPGIDLYDRWRKMEGKDEVIAAFGPLVEADLSDIPLDRAVWYAARDADATLRVYPKLWERITAAGLEDTFWRDMRALPMVTDMAANGMPVDKEEFHALSSYLQSRMDGIQRRMQAAVGRHLDGVVVNPASYPQMSTLIYDKLRLHDRGGKFKSKKGSVKRSTADEILKRYVDLHPVVQQIIDWRAYNKLRGTYADAIPNLTDPDGRVRATFRITRTATGRLSTSKPNLMAQPVRSEEGRRVRDCYIAPDGRELLSGDYSQVEMRVAAATAQDIKMMSIFWEGQDIHAMTASWMFGVPVGQLDEMKHRYPAKRVGFGILYLITAKGLHRELQVAGSEHSLADCEEMIQSWFEIYSGVAGFMKQNGNFARRYGYVKDMWGRRRYIPGIRSVNKWIRLEAERQAGNAPIQMGAAGVVKEAMGRLVPVYRGSLPDTLPLLQIHDDLVWEIPEGFAPAIAPIIAKEMVAAAPRDFPVPLEVDFKVGKRWGSMEKLK